MIITPFYSELLVPDWLIDMKSGALLHLNRRSFRAGRSGARSRSYRIIEKSGQLLVRHTW